jgi:hypothetical protein
MLDRRALRKLPTGLISHDLTGKGAGIRILNRLSVCNGMR